MTIDFNPKSEGRIAFEFGRSEKNLSDNLRKYLFTKTTNVELFSSLKRLKDLALFPPIVFLFFNNGTTVKSNLERINQEGIIRLSQRNCEYAILPDDLPELKEEDEKLAIAISELFKNIPLGLVKVWFKYGILSPSRVSVANVKNLLQTRIDQIIRDAKHNSRVTKNIGPSEYDNYKSEHYYDLEKYGDSVKKGFLDLNKSNKKILTLFGLQEMISDAFSVAMRWEGKHWRT